MFLFWLLLVVGFLGSFGSLNPRGFLAVAGSLRYFGLLGCFG